LREIVRALPLTEGHDVVIVVRPPAAQSDFAALRSEVTLLLKRARLLEPAPPAPSLARES
jgi:ribonuclease P protein component